MRSLHHSRTSFVAGRLFNAAVILTLLMAVLPAAQSPSAAAQEAQTATYIAEKYNCPAGFDPASGDAQNAFDNCTELASGVAFTLSTQDPSYPGDTRNTDGGQAVWSDIPLGDAYSVAESIPQGYGDPWVYCEVTGGPAADQFSFFQAPGGVMDIGLTDPSLTGYGQAYCRWFNVSTEQAPPEEQAVATIAIQKYFCSPHEDPSGGANYQQLLDSCLPGQPGTHFLGQVDGSQQFDLETGDDGRATANDFPGGDLTLRELPPAFPYIWFGRVFCSVYDAAAGPPSNFEEVGIADNQISLPQTPAGQSIACDWFNIPFEGGSVQKYACPEGDLGGASLDSLLAQCPLQTGVQFYYETAGGGGGSGQTTERPFGNWTSEINAGPVDATFIEQIPDGYEAARVFCSATLPNAYPDPAAEYESQLGVEREVDGTAGPETVSANVLQYTQPQNGQFACAWFNFPADGAAQLPVQDAEASPVADEEASPSPETIGLVYVYKLLCPPGLDTTGKSRDDLISDCQDVDPGVEFSVLQNDQQLGVGSTNQNGEVVIPDIAGGLIKVVEEPKEGYQQPRVFCSDYPQGGSFPD
jgi:hypothetical protein